MPFIFKGGTCLILLLKHPMKLSTDIDIVVEPDTDVDTYISKASTIFPFKQCEEQVRIGRNSIEKRHFKFTFQFPITGKDIYILLDILFAENPYARVVDCEIRNDLFTDFDLVYHTYFKVAMEEVSYRGNDITVENAIKDTYMSAVCIASHGTLSTEEYPL